MGNYKKDQRWFRLHQDSSLHIIINGPFSTPFRKTWIPESDRCVCGVTRFTVTANLKDYIPYHLENFTLQSFAQTLRSTENCPWSLSNRFAHGWEPINLVSSLLKA